MHNFLKSSVAAATATVLLATGFAVSEASINANAATLSSYLNSERTGDNVKVDVMISNPTAFSLCNVKVNLGSGFTNTEVYDAGDGMSLAVATEDSSSFQVVQATTLKASSRLLTFYLKVGDNINSSNNKITVNITAAYADGSNASIAGMTNVNVKTNYIKGDVNGDGSTDAKDATEIRTAFTNQRMEIASVAYLNQGHLDEWFPKIHSAEAADANSNGYVEKDADSDTILKAYARIISGTYSGNIGKTFSITI